MSAKTFGGCLIWGLVISVLAEVWTWACVSLDPKIHAAWLVTDFVALLLLLIVASDPADEHKTAKPKAGLTEEEQ